VGHALASAVQQTNDVAVTVFGDGACNQGVIHEALNLASIWKLPMVFICEDNGYALSVRREKSISAKSISDRAAAYSMPGCYVAANDPVAVYQTAGEAINRARTGNGPTLLVIETFRLHGGFEGDAQLYREPGELDLLRERDTLAALTRQPRTTPMLLGSGTSYVADQVFRRARLLMRWLGSLQTNRETSPVSNYRSTLVT
jgi:pyruvate dehydrogenase E1 component alpha subunit